MTCQRCGGTGRIRIMDAIYSQDDSKPCLACQLYCHGCGQWVNKDGHECPPIPEAAAL